ncbi:hypothetical protein [Candidatus Tisiphia endosymbiont of Piscicola geometra]|uniref:hypothetical protein n=1 Tax=Candidatus Tisiphia endosymbiont of Piscicola geometra TaxID=3066273 RepID=UPI00312C8FE8
MLRWLTPPRNDARLVFENGKFLQSYGKDQGGKPITIGYDSKNQQYFGFTNKGSSNSGSIFEAISASSNGKYSADILRGLAQPIPVADTTPPKPPSQPTPQPKPLSQSELSAAQFLVDTLTADKRQLQAKENEYHRNILQIAKQNMHDSAVKKFARDAALMQQAYAIGGESYLPLKRVELGWQAKNLKEVLDNSLSSLIDPKYGGNLPLAVFSTSGDLIDCGMQQIVHVISGVEGGADTLKVLGYLPNKLIGTVKDFSKDIAKEHLPEKWYKGLSDWYKGLPENTKVTATLAADSMVLWGAGRVLQIASGPATSKLYSALEKGVAAEASAFTTVGKASEIGLVGENTLTKPLSMLTKVEQKLPIEALEVERVAEEISLGSATPLTATEKIVENPYLARSYVKEIEEITKLQLPDQQLTLLKEALQTQEFRKLSVVEKETHRGKFNSMRPTIRAEWEQNTGQKWPVYEVDVYDKSGTKILKEKGQPYDAHHIIQSNYGGPNTWWNIHPTDNIIEHKLIHGTGSKANEIFKPK